MPRLSKPFVLWHDVPAQHGPGRVAIRHLLAGEIESITAQATHIRDCMIGDEIVRNSEYDINVDADLTIEAAVDAWEDFTDSDGAEMPCTKSNKLRWANGSTWFRQFVADKRKLTAQAYNDQQEAKTKN